MPPTQTPSEGQTTPETVAAPAAAPDVATEAGIENLQTGISSRVRSLVGGVESKTSALHFKPLPPLPSGRNLAKAAALGAAVAMPHVVPVAALGGYVASKAYGMAVRNTPLSYVDRGVRAATGFAVNGVKGAFEWASYPFRFAGRAGMNTLKLGAKAGVETVKFGVDIFEDIEKAINVKYKLPLSTDLPAQILLAMKNAAIATAKFPFQMLAKYPKTTIATGILGLGFMANAGFDPILASANATKFAGEFIQWVTSFFRPSPPSSGWFW